MTRRAAIAGEIHHGTSIQWTHMPGYVGDTWNPVRGCSRVSPGCLNCYAERMATRFSDEGQPFHLFAERTPEPHWTGRVELIEEKLTEPLHRRRPTCWFVNSMSDLFHEKLPDAAIDRVFAVMALCPQHKFIILTKRAERMEEYCTVGRVGDAIVDLRESRGDFGIVKPVPHLPPGAIWWPLPNVILGVSVENQATADARIPHLLRTPAACRMISLEPQLEDVDLHQYLGGARNPIGDAFGGRGLDWIVSGGESGAGARPFDLEWAHHTRKQCEAAGTSYFLKQLGARPYSRYGQQSPKDWIKFRDRKGGDETEWPIDLQNCRQFPEARHAD